MEPHPAFVIPRYDRPQERWIPADQLHVDIYDGTQGYQRHVNPSKVDKIAREWDDIEAGTITVSIRVGGADEGKFFIVNGQHRTRAAQKRFHSGIEMRALTMPMTREEEARRFAHQNDNVTSLKAYDLFMARLEAKEPDAIDLLRIVHESGWKLAPHNSRSNHNDLMGIKGLVTIYNRYGPAILAESLNMTASVYGTVTGAGDMRVVQGLAFFLYTYPEPFVRRAQLRDKLSRPEGQPKELIKESAKYNTKGMGAVYVKVSRVILDVYDKNRHEENRLEWDLRKYRKAAAAMAEAKTR